MSETVKNVIDAVMWVLVVLGALLVALGSFVVVAWLFGPIGVLLLALALFGGCAWWSAYKYIRKYGRDFIR